MNPSPTATRPTVAFMRPRAARWIALGFGSGLAPRAPGTIGTLWAWVAWLALLAPLGGFVQFAAIVVGLLIGPWACRRTADDLGVQDHGAIVWDEIVAFWIVLAILPPSLAWQIAGFVLFRLLDALKLRLRRAHAQCIINLRLPDVRAPSAQVLETKRPVCRVCLQRRAHFNHEWRTHLCA